MRPSPAPVDALIEAVAQRRPDHTALVFGQRAWSFAQVRDEMRRRAGVLLQAGLAPGDVAITTSPQTDQLVLSFLACCRAGVVLCALSPLLAEPEIALLAARVRPALALTADGPHHATLDTQRALALELPGHGGPLPPASRNPSMPAVLRPTSGTTGALPKIVVMPHRQLTWRLAAPAWWESQDEIYYLPIHNQFTVVDVCYVLTSGATLVLSDATSPLNIEAELESSGATVMLTVPATLALAGALREPARALRLKAIRTSAANLPNAVRLACEARYGVPVVQMYGSTESGFAFATTREGTPAGSIGRPLQGVETRLVHRENGQAVATGDTGELVLRTPGMMLGYLDDPLATDTVLHDGWLATGDLARLDEHGFFTLEGRHDTRITSSGFKIQPEEVEAALAQHPGIREVAVSWDADRVRGSAVVAFVVARGPVPSATDLARFCRQRLAAYKVPRRFVFVDSLPRSALGKVRRGQLRAD